MANVPPNRRRREIADAETEARIESFSQEAETLPARTPTPPKPATAPAPSGSRTTVGFNFKMTPEDHARLKELCAREERSIQYMLNKIVWPAVDAMQEDIGRQQANRH